MLVSRPLRSLAFALALVGGSVMSTVPAFAQTYKAEALELDNLWARPTTGKTGAAYFEIHNSGKTADTLVAIESDVAKTVELHTTTMDGNVMRMRKLDKLPLPAGETAKAAPGGLHVMLIGLKAPLKDGDKVQAYFVFEKAGRVEVSVPVQKSLDAGKDAHTSADGHGAHADHDADDNHDMHDMH